MDWDKHSGRNQFTTVTGLALTQPLIQRTNKKPLYFGELSKNYIKNAVVYLMNK